MPSPTNVMLHWITRHSYVFMIAGLIVFYSSFPISSMFELSEEEYAIMAEYTYATGLPYKGKDFLSWRYDPLTVMFTMWLAALALLLAGVALNGLRLKFEPELWQRTPIGAIFNLFRLKHTAAKM